MADEISTSRGLYRIVEAAPATHDAGAIVLTLALERADGIERVVFRCRIDRAICDSTAPDTLIARVRPWLEREFEITREAALKSIRTERRLHEIIFAPSHPGPFQPLD